MDRNFDALLIVPVVEDHLEAVGVGWRNLVEHIPGHVRTAVPYPQPARAQLTWVFECFRQIQHKPGEMRMCSEKGAYQMTVASADIANGPDAGELIVAERFEYQVDAASGPMSVTV